MIGLSLPIKTVKKLTDYALISLLKNRKKSTLNKINQISKIYSYEVFLVYICRIISDAFSAVIIAGALVLPDVMYGIMELSTTLSPSIPPWTLNKRNKIWRAMTNPINKRKCLPL